MPLRTFADERSAAAEGETATRAILRLGIFCDVDPVRTAPDRRVAP